MTEILPTDWRMIAPYLGGGSSSRYSDLSADEKSAFERIHSALEQSAEEAVEALGGKDKFRAKPTSGFNPKSGIRGYLPKDLWFAVSHVSACLRE
jgi:hypothetical protein